MLHGSDMWWEGEESNFSLFRGMVLQTTYQNRWLSLPGAAVRI